MIKKVFVFLSALLTAWTVSPFLLFAYNYLTLDESIVIVAIKDEDAIVESYHELINLRNDELENQPSVILFNNGWTKEVIQELDYSRALRSCQLEGWNLVYLSNEFGDMEYNRSQVDWFNNICHRDISGFHIYHPDRFDLYEKYILKTAMDSSGLRMSYFPLALLVDSQGNPIDTVYNDTDKLMGIIYSSEAN